MHISEGVLSGPVLFSGMAMAAATTAVGLKHLQDEDIPKTAILTAAFFVASLIHVPIGPSSVHLVLNALLGILLGWTAFPAILVGLALQGILFQFGGITTLGVNAVIMGAPAILSHLIFGKYILKGIRISAFSAFCGGAMAIFFSGLLAGIFLMASDGQFFEIAAAITVAHLPIMVIEGLLTVFCVRFIGKVSPELLPSAGLGLSPEPPILKPSEN